MKAFSERLRSIWNRRALPDSREMTAVTKAALQTLRSEPAELRPPARNGTPGGYVRLSAGDAPSLLVPDLHGRGQFVLDLLSSAPPVAQEPPAGGRAATVLDLLAEGKLFLIFLGDAFHSEARGKERWVRGYAEFLKGNILSDCMLAEMRENFSLMELVMLLKTEFPLSVHFLKGNHENIKNSAENGNLPFYKFSDEGVMTRIFTEEYYGKSFLELYADFELTLPLFVSGPRFLASHAEPRRFFSEEALVNASLSPDVVIGLTWTNNGEAEPDAVADMLARYQPDFPDALYFGGHRPVSGQYALRADGKFVQIHNPARQQVAVVRPERAFDFSADFYSV